MLLAMEAQLITPLSSLENSLNALVTSLTTTNTFNAAPAAAKDLVAADDALISALHTLQQHQQNYARILHLRAEAERLQDQIKSIVRTCVDLKSEIGHIHPSILAYPQSNGRDGDKVLDISTSREVDYKTLLNFAARIGKHNSMAALEAERDSTRRKVEAAQKRKAVAKTNGAATSPIGAGDANATTESRAEVSQLEDAVAAQRAQLGMAFPPGDILRNGALGRLQVMKEQQGDDAVEREIERLVRESEVIAAPEMEQDINMEDDVKDIARSEPRTASTNPTQRRTSTVQVQQRLSRSDAPAPVRKKLDLDFPSSDDEDDD